MEQDERTPLPNRKSDAVISGKLKIWEKEKLYQFESSKSHPEMKREVLLDNRGVRLTKTQGQKEQSIVLSAKVDAGSLDPQGELLAKVQRELKPLVRKLPVVPTSGLLFERTGKLLVWENKKAKQLKVHLILDMNQDKALVFQDLSNCLSEVNKIVYSKK